MKGITDFLQTKTNNEKLSGALDVLKEFRNCESQDEFLNIDFIVWVKLEQFQEFLEHLVNGKPLEEDTLEYIDYLKHSI